MVITAMIIQMTDMVQCDVFMLAGMFNGGRGDHEPPKSESKKCMNEAEIIALYTGKN